MRFKNSGGSYLWRPWLPDVFGLGGAAKLDWLEIRWPASSSLSINAIKEHNLERATRRS
jgi:hypothetical protein